MLVWGIKLPGTLPTPNNEDETSFSDIVGNPVKFKEILNFFSAVCLSFDKTSGVFGCNLMFQVSETASHLIR